MFGNYNVAYVSAGPGQSGQPAGGRFRGGLGKLLFRTTFLGQSVLQPDIVTNKVRGFEGGPLICLCVLVDDCWSCWFTCRQHDGLRQMPARGSSLTSAGSCP